MKKLSLTVFLSFSLLCVKAQTADTLKKVDTGKVFVSVEQEPQFPGGLHEFYMFISRNIRYPAEARANKEQGRVFVQFVVERDGSVTKVHIIRGVSPSLDKEALRLMELSPKWKPGMQNGYPVKVE
jgi:protein TonB